MEHGRDPSVLKLQAAGQHQLDPLGIAGPSASPAFEHANGNGIPLQDIAGYVNIKEITNLNDIRFDDTMSSFRWRPVNPKKPLTDLFAFQPPAGGDDTWLPTRPVVENNAPAELSREATSEFGKQERIPITTTDTFSRDVSVSVSVSHEFYADVSHTTVSV